MVRRVCVSIFEVSGMRKVQTRKATYFVAVRKVQDLIYACNQCGWDEIPSKVPLRRVRFVGSNEGANATGKPLT